MTSFEQSRHAFSSARGPRSTRVADAFPGPYLPVQRDRQEPLSFSWHASRRNPPAVLGQRRRTTSMHKENSMSLIAARRSQIEGADVGSGMHNPKSDSRSVCEPVKFPRASTVAP